MSALPWWILAVVQVLLLLAWRESPLWVTFLPLEVLAGFGLICLSAHGWTVLGRDAGLINKSPPPQQ